MAKIHEFMLKHQKKTTTFYAQCIDALLWLVQCIVMFVLIHKTLCFAVGIIFVQLLFDKNVMKIGFLLQCQEYFHDNSLLADFAKFSDIFVFYI